MSAQVQLSPPSALPPLSARSNREQLLATLGSQPLLTCIYGTMKSPPKKEPLSVRLHWAYFLCGSLGTLAGVALLAQLYYTISFSDTSRILPHATATTARCQSLHLKAGPPPEFHKREKSDRFVPGTRTTLVSTYCLLAGLLVLTVL
jgi:hypothetical protein